MDSAGGVVSIRGCAPIFERVLTMFLRTLPTALVSIYGWLALNGTVWARDCLSGVICRLNCSVASQSLVGRLGVDKPSKLSFRGFVYIC